MPEIRRMYELQGVDLDLNQRNARLAEIKKALGDESALAPLRQESRSAKTEADAASAKQHDLDQVIGGLEAKIVPTENTLESVVSDNAKQQRLVGPAKVGWQEGLRRMVEARHPDWIA